MATGIRSPKLQAANPWLVAGSVLKDVSVADRSRFFDTSQNAVVNCSKFRGHACRTSVALSIAEVGIDYKYD